MIERYLHQSAMLKAVFLLIDIRHEPSKNDKMMYDWILHQGYEPVIIATKLDKIKKSQLSKQLKVIREGLNLVSGTKVIPFSAKTKQGERKSGSLPRPECSGLTVRRSRMQEDADGMKTDKRPYWKVAASLFQSSGDDLVYCDRCTGNRIFHAICYRVVYCVSGVSACGVAGEQSEDQEKTGICPDYHSGDRYCGRTRISGNRKAGPGNTDGA